MARDGVHRLSPLRLHVVNFTAFLAVLIGTKLCEIYSGSIVENSAALVYWGNYVRWRYLPNDRPRSGVQC